MPAAARKIALTDRSMKAFKPAPSGGRLTVWDALMPGMAIRITDKGARSFYAVKRRAGDPQPTWVLLGRYPLMGLAGARAAAREALTALMEGKHPKSLAEAKRQAEKTAAREAIANTFGAVAEGYIAKYLPSIKSAKVYESRIRRELIPAFGARSITTISRRDVLELLEDVAARSGKGAAVGLLAVLRQLLAWAVDRDVIDVNPAAAVKPRAIVGKTDSRDRLLNDDELAAVWRAIPAVGAPIDVVYKLLLLTGARRQEIAAAQWEDFDEAAATLLVPPERAKNGDAMLIPLSPTAVELISETRRLSGPYIFSTTAGRAPVQAFSQAKQRLDAALAAQGTTIEPFVAHDFRRALRSNLSRLGVAPVVAEMCLGHKQRGIVQVYDRYGYLSEKREALLRWEKHLLGIVSPAPDSGGKIVALPSARVRA